MHQFFAFAPSGAATVMISRLWPGLLLTSVLLPAIASSQPPRLGMRKGGVNIFPGVAESERPSHLPVDTGLEKHLRPEDALAARLRGSRDKKSARDLFNDKELEGKIHSLVQQLMRDPKFVDSIKGQFNRDDVEKLIGGVTRGNSGGNSELMKLIGKGLAENKVNDETKDIAKQVQDKLREQGNASSPEGKPDRPDRPNQPKSAATPPTPTPSAQRAEESPPPWKLDPKTEDWLKRNMDRWVKDVDTWASSPGGEGWRGFIKDFAKRYDASKSMAPGLMDKAGGLTKYMPRMSNYLPRPRLSNLPDLPRLPLPSRLGLPSAPSGGSLANGGKALMWLLVFGVAAYLLWRVGGWAERARQARAAEWRLGPWPVRPDGVTTRGELVRAFEYLALLCLGRSARTHHHHDLARQIGSQPSLDPDRRRDAAESLATIYEHARYRPDDEPLPDDEIRRARRELCYLAGVAAA